MRIIVTDTGWIWNHENPILKKYKDIVVVLCLYGKAVTDEYECFVTPYQHVEMGMDQFGAQSLRYLALESVANDFNNILNYQDDIVILADENPETLYPFLALKNRNQYNRLHLCAMSPWKFESKHRMEVYRAMLEDLSALSSFLYIDSSAILENCNSGINYPELLKKAQMEYERLLPRVLNQINQGMDRCESYFFDFKTLQYIPAGKGFCTEDADDARNEVERLIPRIDGKKICNLLREKRMELAELNGIPFESEICPSIGACAGTCSKCDEEANYLRNALNQIPKEQRKYPTINLTEEV